SLPGTIPPTDVLAFNQQWDSRGFPSDDIDFYREDGVELSYSDDGQIILKDRIAESHTRLSEGLDALARGDRAVFKAKALEAIEIYPRNGEALSELAVCLCEEGDLQGALRYAEQYAQYEPENPAAQKMLSSIRIALS
ncbi:MAG: hypothetical protein EBZ48_08570, partial [Proteobacteria bacterium]|nr:hypothetical protein [Pseudomonadota bacterium]